MRNSSKVLLVTHTLVLTALLSVSGLAQAPELGDFIGENSLPADADLICEFPTFPDVSEDLEGLTEGDLIYDFKLYNLEGDSLIASQLLSDGKPALFISASYTCFVFRGKIPIINTLQELYGDQINIYIVYTVEAHPFGEFSPYLPTDFVGEENIAEGILYSQPNSYGERKAILSDMLEAETINVPVFIDGPCNEWWLNFGTNPNNAYLVQPDGVIYDAQKWFNRYPDDIMASIESLLNSIEPDIDPAANGIFSAYNTSDVCSQGIAGETIISHVSVNNLDTIDSYIDILKVGSDMPSDWLTALCTDICYSPYTDEANLYVPAGILENFSVYFYTTPGIVAEGILYLIVQNHFDTEIMNLIEVRACADADATSVETVVQQLENITVYPNPASDFIQFALPGLENQTIQVSVFNTVGEQISLFNFNKPIGDTFSIPVDALQAGLYLLYVKADSDNRVFGSRFVVE